MPMPSSASMRRIKRLCEEVLSKVDPEDLKRRDRQASLIQKIKQRHLIGAGMRANI